MERVFWSFTSQQWFDIGVSLIILFGVLLLGKWIISFLINKVFLRITKKTKNKLDNHILEAARFPIYMFAVVLALNAALARLDFLPDEWNRWQGDGLFVLYFLVGFIFSWRLITNIFAWLGEEV